MRMCHFQVQNGPFVLNKFFLVQTIIITFINLLALFTVQNLKKLLQQIHSFEDVTFLKNSSSGSRIMICNFWVQNGPFAQMRIFSENLLMNLVSFIHAYLHAKNQTHLTISPFHCAKF